MQSNKPKFAIFGNNYQVKKAASAEHLLTVLQGSGADFCIENQFHGFLTSVLHLRLDSVERFDRTEQTDADIAISMGGDGTFLETADYVRGTNMPVLGINTGHLGFLADVNDSEIDETISEIISKQYRIEERTNLQLVCPEYSESPFALNEISVLKHDISSMINIHTEVNGEYITTYRADGLIVCTPTGSTAYSLSNGGPIVVPQSSSFLLTPVAPHSLGIRPIVINDNSVIDLTVESRSGSFLISVDGRSERCTSGMKLTLRKAPHTTKIVRRERQSFFHTLKDKLMWGADSRS